MEMPRSARNALIGAGFLTGILVAAWYAAFHIAYVARVDASVFWGFRDIGFHPHAGGLASSIANLCDTIPYVVLASLPVAVALRRGRPVVAVGVLMIVVGACATTEVLKALLAMPRPGDQTVIGQGSFPSGHATAAMALVLSAVLASPASRRPLVAALGAGFALAVVYSLLLLGWHYPSDTLGGLLVASIWALLALAAIRVADARAPHRRPVVAAPRPQLRSLAPSAVAVGAAIGLAALVFLLRPAGVLEYAHEHTDFVVGALCLGGLSLVLATGVMLTTLRR